MPGLVGIISANPQAASHLDAMVDALAREPGFAVGRARNAGDGVHVGWVLHRNSFSDCLPIENETRDISVFVTGEVFTPQQRLDQLSRHGHRFSSGDASHLVHLYEEEGERFVDNLNGQFCGLLIDRRRGICLLFNDRYGASRMYLHEALDGLYFASEAKALLRLFPSTRRLDATAVAQSFSVGCVLGERTLFEGVRLLPPASRWSVDRRKALRRDVYFRPSDWVGQEPLPDEQFAQELRDTFATLLPPYLQARSPPAMSLTGGIDGRMIMAWAHPAPGTLACYSFGSLYRDCHDVRLARQVAALCHQRHQSLIAGADMLRDFPSLAARCIDASDGTMDVSGAVEVYVNRLARGISPIRLTGNYGSEIVRGNVAFRPRSVVTRTLEPQMEAMVAGAQETYLAERTGSDLAFIAFKQVPWHHHARLAVEQSVLTVRSPYLDNRLVALMFRASPAMRANRDLSLRIVHEGNAALGALPTDRGYAHNASGALVRVKSALREFSARTEYAYDYGMPHWLAAIDRTLSPLRLERAVLGRHKFYHFRTWYQRELAPFVRDALLSPGARAASWYRPGALRAMVVAHTQGRENHTLALHRALTLELIQRRLIEGETSL
jgi:asparagine synthase (glutamine-hydrolysing)